MGLTEEDVKRIIAEQEKPRSHNNDMIQWAVRAAFEEAWRLAGGDPARSDPNLHPVGWRAAWMSSNARNLLVKNGLISGEDTYK